MAKRIGWLGWLGSGGVSRAHFEILRHLERAHLVPLPASPEAGHTDVSEITAASWPSAAPRIPDNWRESVDAVWISELFSVQIVEAAYQSAATGRAVGREPVDV